jgi:hypothetical protein
VNADEISRELADPRLPEAVINVRAARAMLERMEHDAGLIVFSRADCRGLG